MEHINWLKLDLKPWFPYQVPYFLKGTQKSIRSLFLSRVDVAPYLPKGIMNTDARIAGMTRGAPKTERLSKFYENNKLPTEAEIVSYLSLLAAGLKMPK